MTRLSYPLILIIGHLSVITAQQGSPYYGLPLGSIFSSNTGTQGEVYALETRKIIIRNFQHIAAEGCSVFMAGPPVAGYNISVAPNKEGILLAVQTQIEKRQRRQAPKSDEKLEKAATNDGGSQDREKPIEADDQLSALFPVTRRTGLGRGIIWGDPAQQQQQKQQQEKKEENQQQQEQQQKQQQQEQQPKQLEQETSNAPSKTPEAISKSPDATSISPDTPTQSSDFPSQSSAASSQPSDASSQPVLAQRKGGIVWGDLDSTSQRPPITEPVQSTESSRITESIQLANGEPSNRRPSKLRQLPIEYVGGINTPDEEEGKNNPNVTLLLQDPFNPEPPVIQSRPVTNDPSRIYTIIFGGTKSTSSSTSTSTAPSTVKIVRGLPSLSGSESFRAAAPGTLDGGPTQAGELGAINISVEDGTVARCVNGWCVVPDPRRLPPPAAPTPSPATTAPPAGNGSHDNLFFPVVDRRSQFLPAEVLTALRRGGPEELEVVTAKYGPLQEETKPAKELSNNLPVLASQVQDPGIQEKASPSEQLVLPRDGNTYILSRFKGDNVVAVLPEPYELGDFQWFGIYDYCKKTRVASVNVRGVQPPKAAKLDGLRGWQYDVDSGDIYVKNCNTIEITNFTFSGAGKTEAYIFVGNGAFPHSIIQKTRAVVDGIQPDKPLTNFNEDTITVRLPAGWKTFDITWLAVFNPKGNVSYGHVIIPQLVVPPCEETKKE